MQSPITIIVDTREQLPFSFDRIRPRSMRKSGPEFLDVRTVREGLPFGDYAARMDDGRLVPLAVERKSHADLFSTLTGTGSAQKRQNMANRGQTPEGNRDRFERELCRARDAGHQLHLVVECGMDALTVAPPRSSANPSSVIRTLLSWSIRWPILRVWTAASRGQAEQITYRLLEFGARNLLEPSMHMI